ncbi:MAG: RNA-binding protein [Candidatus Omnitrophica bacterium]|nr:RNA-binding protein [Candidatus Omnitrophota bacterium]
MEEEKKIYIGNLEYGVTESDLRDLLSEKGIKAGSISLITDKYTGRPKGFGFIEFESADEAGKAIEVLNELELNGRAIKANKAQKMKPRNENSGGGGYGRSDSRY